MSREVSDEFYTRLAKRRKEYEEAEMDASVASARWLELHASGRLTLEDQEDLNTVLAHLKNKKNRLEREERRQHKRTT